jgi:hypothetical protein
MPSSFSNLKMLKIYSLELFNIGNEALDPVRYPKLESITLGIHHRKNFDMMDDCLNLSFTPFPNIKELKLSECLNFHLLEKAQFLFPNVVSLTFEPNEGCLPKKPDPEFRFNCRDWQLEKLTVFRVCRLERLFETIQYIRIDGKFVT